MSNPTTPPAGDRQHVPTDQAAPERIWLDLPSFNKADRWALSTGHRKDGWPEYVRADLAAPSAPAEVKGLVSWLTERQSHWMTPNYAKTATALTAQQAEYADFEKETQAREQDFARKIGEQQARAERAEADRDALLAAIGEWARPTGANGMTAPSEHHPLMVARAKLKGDV